MTSRKDLVPVAAAGSLPIARMRHVYRATDV